MTNWQWAVVAIVCVVAGVVVSRLLHPDAKKKPDSNRRNGG